MNVRTRGSFLTAGLIGLALLAGCEKSSDSSNAVATPTFNPAGGTKSAPVDVTIATTTTGATIHYTTDGSTPSATVGTAYTAPVHIAATTTLKAIAFKTGMDNSSVKTATYTFTTSACLKVVGTSASANGEIAVSLQFPLSGATDFTTDAYTASFDIYFPDGVTLPSQMQTQYPDASYAPMYFNNYDTLSTGQWLTLSFPLAKSNRAYPAPDASAPLNSAATAFRLVTQTASPDTAVEYCVKNLKVTNGTNTPLDIPIASDTDPASLSTYVATGTATLSIAAY